MNWKNIETLLRISIRWCVDNKSCTTPSTDSSEQTSIALMMSVSPRKSFPFSSSSSFFARFRRVAYTVKRFSLSLASKRAVCSPMPVEQPVTRTIFGAMLWLDTSRTTLSPGSSRFPKWRQDSGDIPGEGVGDTPLCKPFRYGLPQRVWFLGLFDLKTGLHFAHFGLVSGMVFERTAWRERMNVFIISIPNN